MMYTWLVTVEFTVTDSFVYSCLGKLQHTQVELRHIGFKVYDLKDYYTPSLCLSHTLNIFNSFIAAHSRASMITLARLQLDIAAIQIE